MFRSRAGHVPVTSHYSIPAFAFTHALALSSGRRAFPSAAPSSASWAPFKLLLSNSCFSCPYLFMVLRRALIRERGVCRPRRTDSFSSSRTSPSISPCRGAYLSLPPHARTLRAHRPIPHTPPFEDDEKVCRSQTRPSNPPLNAARLNRIEGPPGASCHAPQCRLPVPSRSQVRPAVTHRPITPLDEPYVTSLSQNAPITSLINPRPVSLRSLNEAQNQALTVKCTSRPQSSRPQSSRHGPNRVATSPIESLRLLLSRHVLH